MPFLRIFLCFCFAYTTLASGINIDKIVIWGHKLHTHTHSYIHHGFYKAFEYLGYQVYWFSDQDIPENFNFSNTLFLTEEQVATQIPIRDDCYYIFHHCWDKNHNCGEEKYKDLISKKKAILIKCFWKQYLDKDPEWEEVSKYIYKSVRHSTLVFPWGTDLLPFEIDELIEKVVHQKPTNKISYIGTVGKDGLGANFDQINPFMEEAKKSSFSIFISDPWANPISNKKQQKIIQNSFLAPAIQGKWQCEVGYIPCRIFKNISYGKLGITNSKYVYDLFEGKIVYNADTRILFHDSVKALKDPNYLKIQKYLMKKISSEHTYLNRIQLILDFFEELTIPKD